MKKLQARTYHVWTEEETNFLKENYKKMKVSAIAKALGVTEQSVKSRAKILKIQASWSSKQERRRLVNKINSMAKRWTVEETEYLKNNYDKVSMEEMIKKIGKTASAINGKIRSLKLQGLLNSRQLPLNLEKKSANRERWTISETKYLKNNINIKPIAEICKELGRGENSVKSKLNRMRMKKIYAVKEQKQSKVSNQSKQNKLTKLNIKNIILALSLIVNVTIISVFVLYFLKFIM